MTARESRIRTLAVVATTLLVVASVPGASLASNAVGGPASPSADGGATATAAVDAAVADTVAGPVDRPSLPAATADGPAATADRPAATPGPDDGQENGSLVVVGGGLDPENEAVFDEMIRLGGGPDEATVAIVPAASATPVDSGQAYARDFRNYGVAPENVSVVPLAVEDDPNTDADESTWADNADDESVVQTLQEADVVFYTGGSQLRITDVMLRDDGSLTPAAKAIRDTYRDGGVVGGSSAGAAIMSQDMIGAGQSYAALRNGVSYEDTYFDDADNRVYLTRGMGYLDHGIVDQHFHARSRTGRLIRAMWHRNESQGLERQTLAYGIGENTSLVFEAGTSVARVVGTRGVTVVDASDATEQPTPDDPDAIDLDGLETHYLTDGDAYDYVNRSLVTDEGKTETEGYYYDDEYDYVEDVFLGGNKTVDLMARGVADNQGDDATGVQLGDDVTAGQGRHGVSLNYSGTAETAGWYDADRGKYAAESVRLNVTPFTEPYQEPPGIENGSTLLAGGRLSASNAGILGQVVALGGGSQAADVVVVPAASANASQRGDAVATMVEGAGVPASNVTVVELAAADDPTTPDVDESTWADNADSAALADEIADATVVYFTGGDPTRLTGLLREGGTPTAVGDAVDAAHADGAVLVAEGDTASALGTRAVTGGDSYGALRNGVGPDGVQVGDGLGYVQDAAVDAHFERLSRTGRLLRAAWHADPATDAVRQTHAYGISEGTAVVFKNDTTTASVVGQYGVTVMNVSGATEHPSHGGALNVTGVVSHYLTAGDTYDYANGTVTAADGKDATGGYYGPDGPGGDAGYDYVPDVFTTPYTPSDLMARGVADNTRNVSVGEQFGDGSAPGPGPLGVRLTYRQVDATQAYYGNSYTAVHTVLDVRPVWNGSAVARFESDEDDDRVIGFEEVLATIAAFNEGRTVEGEPVTFENVLDVVAAFNTGRQV